MLLPCTFLANHVQRVRSYVLGLLSDTVVQLESNIGVTKAGRSQKGRLQRQLAKPPEDEPKLFIDGQMQREHARLLVGSINDISTWIIFAKRSPQWDIESVDFLLGLLGGSARLRRYREVEGAVFRETLDYLRNYSEACLEITQTSEARMQLQLDIVTGSPPNASPVLKLTPFSWQLYTSIAQDDGQTSARLAVSAGKDSTSMKIIALITAAFLPGTFVAVRSKTSTMIWTESF